MGLHFVDMYETMKLSRAGWNNVIIFSIMAFILMINVTNKKLFLESDQTSIVGETYVVSDGSVILTLMVNQQMTVEREGVTWRTVPDNQLSSQAAEQMMRAWHQAKGQLIEPEFNRNTTETIVVSMMIAGLQNIHLYSIYPSDELFVIFNHQTAQYIALPPQLFSQLLPIEIFNTQN